MLTFSYFTSSQGRRFHTSTTRTMWKPNTITVVFSSLGAGAGLLCLLKDYMGGPLFDYGRTVRIEGKVAIVTGANTGIGLETARLLANRGAKVIMACRDMEKCEEARKKIVIDTDNKYVYCRPCDLSSLQSVRDFVERFKKEEPKLDVLINNAGVMRCPRTLTKEGFEMQFGVNHLGHFLLTNLLLDSLKKAAPSRIVVVSSVAHKRGTIHKDDLNLEKDYDPADAYNQSKLANLLFSNELSRRLLGTGVTVNAVHPGLVDTNIIRHMSYATSIGGYLLYPFCWPFIKTPAHGAQTILYLAMDTNIKDVTGEYFVDLAKAETSELAKDMELSRWLWRVSEKWTRLNTSTSAATQEVAK